MSDLIGSMAVLIPIILGAFVLRWIRIIRLNSEQQTQQNKEIIALVQKLADKPR
jgi:hypothetical protein